jgi:hypothetical protein
MRSAKPDAARGLFGLNQYYNTTLTQKLEKLLSHTEQNGFSLCLIYIYFFIIVSTPACFLGRACLRFARVVEAGDLNI